MRDDDSITVLLKFLSIKINLTTTIFISVTITTAAADENIFTQDERSFCLHISELQFDTSRFSDFEEIEIPSLINTS